MSTNLPLTVWGPQPAGNGEFVPGSAATLADSSALQLADSSGNTLVDAGTTFVPLPVTTWTEDDSK